MTIRGSFEAQSTAEGCAANRGYLLIAAAGWK